MKRKLLIHRFLPAFLSLSIAIGITSCIPQRQYNELKKANEETVRKQTECNKKNVELEDTLKRFSKTFKTQSESIRDLSQDTSTLGGSNRRLNNLNNQINNAYERLLQKIKELEGQDKLKSSELTAEMVEASKRLKEQEGLLKSQADDLKKREDALSSSKKEVDEYKKNLGKSQSDLADKQKNIAELQSKLAQKDSAVNALKNTVSKALNSYKDKGLTVSVKNGKVYVSVEDKLLFESGKYSTNETGKQALIQVASVLLKETDVNILVEGHTDNVPFKGVKGGVIQDNWDLSVLRATEVTKLLIKNGVGAERVSAAGRGETLPLMSNATPDGRAKNRRTEIILTPKLDELFKILE